MRDMREGQTVYYIEPYEDMAREAKVVYLEQDYAVLEDCFCKWKEHVKYDRIYKTEQECIDAIKAMSTEKVNAYKEEMPDINSCLIFAYKHHISRAEEYADWDARRAYKERVFELTGIKLED